ncbi:hypothetical protein ILUMI_15224 [Ignelater luminosus]|uniref:Uncharacterized protein n=1 Tax=Ignelater luminosus TaxID=2038154 RepID=A0A8K0CP06_IGNLU|nr:hypothetical protein ILUMI_15224 [Ignelater luminosus]
MPDKQPTVICCQRKDSNKNSSVFSDSDPYVSDEGSDYVPDTNTSESSNIETIFTEEYNITFKASKSDSCSTCNSIHVSLRAAKAKIDVPKIEQLNTELDLHHRTAQAGPKAIENRSKEVSENLGTYAITFDLPQTLPTPKLFTGPTFYKKKVFCYNFSIHCLHFYMWDDSTAGRGADAIGSCLLKHFEMKDIWGEKLVAISDSCGGQNENWSLVAVWLRQTALG